jgi:hypothetical protein
MTSVFENKTAIEHAKAAAEAIRAINHLTMHHTGLPYPTHADQVISELVTLAGRRPQAFRQIAAQVQYWEEAGELGIDYSDYPAGETASIRRYLTKDAPLAAGALHDALAVVDEALAHAYYAGPLDDCAAHNEENGR